MEFLASAPDLARCPAGEAPEVAFAGRSNAGKSSVLNRLTGDRHTAKVSKTPGRTRLLNFFALENGARLVDLPGYGYARASAKSQAKWQAAVNEYLSFREQLAGVVLVTDIRHPGMAFRCRVHRLGPGLRDAAARAAEQGRQTQARRPGTGAGSLSQAARWSGHGAALLGTARAGER